MKKIKLIFALIAIALTYTSCLVDDEADSQVFAETPFVVGFERSTDTYVLTPTITDTQSSGDIHVQLTGGNSGIYASSNMVFRYEVDSSTTLTDADYNITSTSDTFTIPANREVADELFSYEIIPTNIPFDEPKQLVINLVPVSGPDSVGGQLVINVTRCDPPLVGAYTAANTINGSSNGDGEAVNIIALGCNLYQMDNLPNFNGVFALDFFLNDDNSITFTGTLGDFSNVVTGSGILLANGTIQVNDCDVANTNTGIDMSFDLVPN
ncbi:hypothetical protein [uncultured Lacinutrix sp.]|uniref:hypothetical protein n=1 Tax=uncultured Lacinutrix sp. TaxID=574032 RepID=UPI00261347A0|nr:hypothetical protein [uncultured Lacinutrix sp.]